MTFIWLYIFILVLMSEFLFSASYFQYRHYSVKNDIFNVYSFENSENIPFCRCIWFLSCKLYTWSIIIAVKPWARPSNWKYMYMHVHYITSTLIFKQLINHFNLKANKYICMPFILIYFWKKNILVSIYKYLIVIDSILSSLRHFFLGWISLYGIRYVHTSLMIFDELCFVVKIIIWKHEMLSLQIIVKEYMYTNDFR